MPLFFLFKKSIGYLLAPATVICLLLSIGLLRLLLSGKSKRSGWVWVFLGTLCFYLFATAPLPSLLLSRLEQQYPPLLQIQEPKEIKYIVVLASDRRGSLTAPPTSLLEEASAFRVVEGIRLFRLLQGQPILIMSGGNDLAERMVAFARSLGVPPEKLVAENRSLDTHANAREVKTLVQQAPFLLVTSASHMPRSMQIFQLSGLQPIPAPADFRWPGKGTSDTFLPSGQYLTEMAIAVHEYLGLAYLNLFPGRMGK